MEDQDYVVYILECGDGTLYTGMTNNLEQRLKRHREGTGAKYTRGRGPFTLRWVQRGVTRSEALKREWEIKRMDRKKKWKLIQREAGDETAEEL